MRGDRCPRATPSASVERPCPTPGTPGSAAQTSNDRAGAHRTGRCSRFTGCGPCVAQIEESSHCNLHDRPRRTGGSQPGGSVHSGTPGQAPRSLPKSVHTAPVIICECCPILLPMNDSAGAPPAPSSESATRMAAGPLATPGVVSAADDVPWCHELSQVAAQRSAYRDMRADSISVRSAGHLDHAPADAPSTVPAAPSADTSVDSTQAREPPRAQRSWESVPEPCSIRSWWPSSGRSLLAPTSRSES